jgi:hypothetical protein
VLDKSGILVTLQDQRASGDGTIPNLSSTAIDIDAKLLKKAGVTGLHIEVVK